MSAYKNALQIISTVLTFSVFSCAARHYGGEMGGWSHMMGYWHYGGIMWLILLIALCIAVYFIFKTAKLKGPDSPPTESALEILKKRYAKGEINKEEYDRKKKDIEA